jgi:hypothetical protein
MFDRRWPVVDFDLTFGVQHRAGRGEGRAVAYCGLGGSGRFLQLVQQPLCFRVVGVESQHIFQADALFCHVIHDLTQPKPGRFMLLVGGNDGQKAFPGRFGVAHLHGRYAPLHELVQVGGGHGLVRGRVNGR